MSSTEKEPGKSTLLAPDGKPLDFPAPRCGNCTFWHIDLKTGDGRGFCYGEPAKLFMVAPPQRLADGQVAYHMEVMRPKFDKHEPPCALHKPRVDS